MLQRNVINAGVLPGPQRITGPGISTPSYFSYLRMNNGGGSTRLSYQQTSQMLQAPRDKCFQAINYLHGIDNISDYAITFHYVSPMKMYDLDFYIYHLRPYGIQSGNQDLNQ